MNNVLITGGTGFLGSYLIKALIKSDFKITVLKRSTSRLDRIKTEVEQLKFVNVDEINLTIFAENNEFDYIIHCATNYGRKNNNPLEIIEANLQLPLKLLTVAEQMGVKVFINTDTILDKRINFYSLAKSQFVDWMNFYAENLICVNISLEHFYGPDDDPSKFVSFILKQLLNNVEQIELTEGAQRRDFIYISDVINAFLHIINSIKSEAPGIYNFEVGSGSLISIKDAVLLMKELTKNKVTNLNFGAIDYRENEIMRSNVNIDKIKELGWECKVSLYEGLLRTIAIEKEKVSALIN